MSSLLRLIPLPLVPPMALLAILPVTHTVALRLTLLGLSALLALHQLLRQPRPPRPPLLATAAAWAVLPLLLLPFAVDPGYSLGEAKSEIGYALLACGAFYVLTSDEARCVLLLRSLMLALAVMSACAVVFYAIDGHWNPERFFGGVASHASYIVTALPAGVLLWLLSGKGSWDHRLLPVLAVVALTAGMLTGQRALFIALAFQALVLGLHARRGMAASASRPRLVGAALMMAALLLGLFAASVELRFGDQASHVAQAQADPRFTRVSEVIERIRQHPLTGVGFGIHSMRKASADPGYSADQYWHAHNIVLNYGVQLGVPGMIVILLLFAGLLRVYLSLARSADRILAAVGLAGILLVAGVFLRNQFNDLFQRDLALLFWAMNGMFLGLAWRRRGVAPAAPSEAAA